MKQLTNEQKEAKRKAEEDTRQAERAKTLENFEKAIEEFINVKYLVCEDTGEILTPEEIKEMEYIKISEQILNGQTIWIVKRNPSKYQ